MIKLNKGLISDVDYVDMPAGSWRHARNMLYFDRHEAIVSEKGMSSFAGLPSNYVEICRRPVKDDKFVVFSCHKNNYHTQSGSEIGILDINGNYTTVINDNLLNFSPNNHISCEHKYNSAGELIIVFTDDYNPPRILNITNPGIDLSGTSLTSATELNGLRVFPEVLPPYVPSVKVNDSGGVLKTGMYGFFFAYETATRGITNYTHVSNLVAINQDPKSVGFDTYDGDLPETQTNKSITINIENVDTRYTTLYICVAKYIGGVISYARIQIVNVTGPSLSYTYTGNESEVTIADENVNIDRITYNKIKDFTQLDGFLYGLNVASEKEIGYQPYALDIEVKWLTEYVALRKINDSHKDPDKIYAMASFMPGEVYAFYAIPVLKDGTFGKAYHIPGRAPKTVSGLTGVSENDLISDVITNNPSRGDFLNDQNVGEQVRYFHTRDTSDSDGTMGFWENNDETYPDDLSYVSNAGVDLRGEKVRHSKFPSIGALKDHGFDYLEQLSEGIIYQNKVREEWQAYSPIQYPNAPTKTQLDFGDSPIVLEDGTLSNNERTYTYSLLGPVNVNVSFSIAVTLDLAGASVGGQTIDTSVVIYKNGSPILTETESFVLNIAMDYMTVLIRGSVQTTISQNDTITIELDADFPFWQWSTSEFIIKTANVESTDNYLKSRVLGVEFSNVFVPEEIADKIQGFVFGYAKRTGGNMTVLGHSMSLFASEYQLSGAADGALGTNALNATIDGGTNPDISVDKSILRFHDFGMIRSKIAGSAFVNNDLELQVSGEPIRDINDPDGDYVNVFDYVSSDTTEVVVGNDDKIRAVSLAEYIDHNVQVSDNYFNLLGESCLKLNISNPDGQLSLTPPSVDITSDAAVTHKGYLSTINAFRLNVYNAFYLQPNLVLAGASFLQVTQAGIYRSQPIFEGDVKLNAWGFRATAPYNHSTKSSSGDDLVKALKIFYYLPVFSPFILGYRHGTSATEHYWPGVKEEGTSAEDWHGRNWDIDNNYSYNDDYNKLNDINVIVPFRHDVQANNGNHPNRVIRFQQTDPEEIVESWQVHLPNDYWEFMHHRGEIWRGEAMSDRLIINLEESSVVTVGKDRLEANVTEIYLGIGDIFQGDPTEMIKSIEGYMGLQSQFGAVLTRAGYFFTDQNHGKVFLLGNSIDEISGMGLRNYIRDELPCKLAAQLGRLDGVSYRFDYPGNPVMPAVQMSYDEKYNRVFLSKRDYVIADEDNYKGLYSSSSNYGTNDIVLYNNVLVYFDTDGTGALFSHENPDYDPDGLSPWDEFVQAHPITDKPSLTIDKSFTLSFSLAINRWICFHDYVPDLMAHNRNILLFSKDGTLYRHNEGPVGSYFGSIYKSYIDPVFTFKKPVYIQSFKWITSVEENDIVDWDASFDKAWVYNRDQASVVVDLERTYSLLSRGVFRHIDDYWQFNGFYDAADSPDFIDADFEPQNVSEKSFSKKKRFIGNYVVIRLISLNETDKPIYLYGIAPITRPAKR